MKKLHNTTVKKYTLATLLLGAGMHSFAQETPKKVDPATPVTIDSFDVVRDYKPILADAVKIRRSPDMTNKREYQPKLSYNNISDKKLDINTGLRELNVKELPFSQLADQTSNYVKFGVGNYNTILGEAYLAVDKFENTRFGLFAKHLNQKGSIEGQKFATQDVGIFGRRVYEPFTVNGTLGYNRYSTNFYGQVFDNSSNLINTTPEAQAFNDIYFNGELTSNADVDKAGAVSYSAKADAYLFKDKYDAKENSFAISGYVNKKVNTFNVGANLSASFNSVEDVKVATKNHVASINPYVKFKGDNYNVTLGANLVSEFGDTSRFNVFPTVEADFAVVPQYVYLFAGANGGVKQGSLRGFAKENPYLNSNIDVRNTLEKLNVYAGLKGNAGANFGYKVKAFYKQIEGLPLYVNSREELGGGFVPYKFDVIYDGYSSKATHFGIEGEMNVRVSQLVNLSGKLNIDDYKVKDNEEAWSLPKFRFLANARFNISDKFFVDAELSTQGQTSALAYTYTSSTVRSENPSKVTIPSFADFNAGAEYRIKKQLGVFVKANNIFGKEYERYQYYPRLGFNIIGGINFSF